MWLLAFCNSVYFTPSAQYGKYNTQGAMTVCFGYSIFNSWHAPTILATTLQFSFIDQCGIICYGDTVLHIRWGDVWLLPMNSDYVIPVVCRFYRTVYNIKRNQYLTLQNRCVCLKVLRVYMTSQLSNEPLEAYDQWTKILCGWLSGI